MKGKKIKKEYVIYRQNLKIIFFLAFFITLLFCYVSSVPQIELPTFSLSSIQVVKFPVSDNLSIYRIVASASPSRFEAHVGLFRLLMKGIFDPYVL